MMIKESITIALAQLLEMPPSSLTLDTNFSDLGVDSLIGLRFARRLEELTGRDIELEWLFDYPTISQLADFLQQSVAVGTSVTRVKQTG